MTSGERDEVDRRREDNNYGRKNVRKKKVVLATMQLHMLSLKVHML